jgi:hypothetical protein
LVDLVLRLADWWVGKGNAQRAGAARTAPAEMGEHAHSADTRPDQQSATRARDPIKTLDRALQEHYMLRDRFIRSPGVTALQAGVLVAFAAIIITIAVQGAGIAQQRRELAAHVSQARSTGSISKPRALPDGQPAPETQDLSIYVYP